MLQKQKKRSAEMGPVKSQSDSRVRDWYHPENYDREKMLHWGAWQWAWYLGVRRWCWWEILEEQAFRGLQPHFKTNRSRALFEVIEMLQNEPLFTAGAIKSRRLVSTVVGKPVYFFDTTDLEDAARSPHPDFYEPTIDELEELVRGARRNARSEPWRCGCDNADHADHYADYLPISTFIPDQRVFLLRGRPRDAELKMQISAALNKIPISGETSQDPNAIDLTKFIEYGILPYLDLTIWGMSEDPEVPFDLMAMAGLIFDGDLGLSWKVAKRTAPLARGLMDENSREWRELIACAAREHAAKSAVHHEAQRRKRGRKPLQKG